jgi:hypothetical protein
MLLIDTDNAAGSPRGDVDDAFAIAALLRSGLPVAAFSSVAGNTSEALADRNNRTLGELCGYTGPHLRGVHAGDVPDRIDRAADLRAGGPLRFLALGPLTNLAAVLGKIEIAEAILVGGNLTSRGRFPPWWPHELNLTQDRERRLRLGPVPHDRAAGRRPPAADWAPGARGMAGGAGGAPAPPRRPVVAPFPLPPWIAPLPGLRPGGRGVPDRPVSGDSGGDLGVPSSQSLARIRPGREADPDRSRSRSGGDLAALRRSRQCTTGRRRRSGPSAAPSSMISA